MQCDDLDRLRADNPQSQPKDWPLAAKEHLATCDRCAQLDTFLNQPQQVDFSAALQRKIEDGIIPDLHNVAPIPSTLRVTVSLAVVALAMIAASNYHLGVAGWQARAAWAFATNAGILAIAFALLAGNVSHAMSPGSSRQSTLSLFSPYLVLPVIALFASNTVMYSYREMMEFAPLAFHCWKIGVTVAAVCAPLFWLALRRGFVLNFIAEGAAVGLMSGLVGVTVLEIFCPLLERAHITAGHVGAAITATLVGAIIGGVLGRIKYRTA